MGEVDGVEGRVLKTEGGEVTELEERSGEEVDCVGEGSGMRAVGWEGDSEGSGEAKDERTLSATRGRRE